MDINPHYKVQLLGHVDNNLVNIDRIETEVDNGIETTYHLSRENIEDLHMALGDDKFHEYLITVLTITDKKGLQYIETFSKTFEVPDPKEQKTVRKDFDSRKTLETLQELKLKHHHHFGCDPDYFIMSRKAWDEAQMAAYDQYGYHRLQDSDGQVAFEGIPIAILPNNSKMFIQAVAYAGEMLGRITAPQFNSNQKGTIRPYETQQVSGRDPFDSQRKRMVGQGTKP